jgi:two-component system invasion response regulator UvrY
MSIRVLLADDSDAMRVAIVRVLAEVPEIEFVGEATCYAETLQLTAHLKPDVLLLDLHMHDEHHFPPEVVKPIILRHAKHVVAISLRDDENANLLAESLGAKVLLGKTKLYGELISSIKRGCVSLEAPMPYGDGKHSPMNGDRVKS